MIIAITPTGGRPDAFALCEYYMARQTQQPDLWIVVDDCDPPTKCTMGQIVIRPEPRWQHWPEGGSTQHRNMLAALGDCTADDLLIFWEDDDWYAPDYIKKQISRLANHPLVGEIPARYYNVCRGLHREFGNTPHASLCATAMRGSLIPELREACECRAWIDMHIWRRHSNIGKLYQGESVAGIKGMPGRPGVSAAHRNEPTGQWSGDPDGSRLRQWIGDDAASYARFRIGAAKRETPAIPEWPKYDNPNDFESYDFMGQVQYRCPEKCGYNNYDPATVMHHWIDSHKKQDALGGPTLFDSDDKPIERKMLVPGKR